MRTNPDPTLGYAEALADIRRIAERIEEEIGSLESARRPDRDRIMRLSIRQGALYDAIAELSRQEAI
jgi:hypothetical protein